MFILSNLKNLLTIALENYYKRINLQDLFLQQLYLQIKLLCLAETSVDMYLEHWYTFLMHLNIECP